MTQKRNSTFTSTNRLSCEALSFNDVLLVPAKGQAFSRNDIELQTTLAGDIKLRVPIVSSPMPTVTGWKLARAIGKAGGLGILHRFNTPTKQQRHYVKASKGMVTVGCAVGVSEKDTYSRINSLFEVGCRIFVIDVAHGHSVAVEKYMEGLDSELKRSSIIIAGSTATGEGARFLAEIGADGIRVGIGNGAACTTREKTGVGVPQITALMESYDAVKGLKNKDGLPITILSCGGIETAGDIAKAIAAGASCIMLGKLLSGTKESPRGRSYAGAASKKTKRNGRYVEGVSGKVPKTGKVASVVGELCDGLRSSLSYCGFTSLSEALGKSQFVKVGAGSREESATRI